ncbi:MAG: succinylglutamate desuccinylase, partial [Acidobacteria bacterium]
MDRRALTGKIVIAGLGCWLLAASGASFYRSRNLAEPVVLGPGVTAVTRLSTYFTGLAGTVNDCNLYVLEGKEPGGTVLVLGGSHPEEPAGRLAAWLLVENAVVQKGRLIVALSANRSGT